MNDFFGKEIKVGDTIELRADGFDESSAFRKGVVFLSEYQELSMKTEHSAVVGVEYWSLPLSYLEMSNDIVKVESE